MTVAPVRRLAAILIADVAGYSRMMESDESGTHARLREIRSEVTDPAIARHGGRIVRTAGDGMLVEFASAIEALSCAVAMQREMLGRNRALAPESRIEYRIGLNIGDILIDGSDVAGDGVNVAARLESLAAPGGIAISRAVREQVRQVVGVQLTDAGHHRVKNISRPIRVFTVQIDGAAARRRSWARPSQRVWLAALALCAAVAAAGGSWWAARARTFDPPPQSLVLLPVSNLSGVAGGDTVASMLNAQLATALTQLSGAIVIAGTNAPAHLASAATSALRPADAREVGRDLNVRYVIAVQLLAANEMLRVAVQLIATDDGVQLWSDQLEVANRGADVPLDLIGRLADDLRLHVRRAAFAQPLRVGDPITLTLRAMAELDAAETRAAYAGARATFQRALQLQPDSPLAWAGLAKTAALEYDRSPAGGAAQRLLSGAEDASLRAINLAPGNAEVWETRALVLRYLGQNAAAEEAIHRSLRLNPYSGDAEAQRGLILLATGRTNDAIAAFDRAIALNPASDSIGAHLNHRCRAQLYLGRYRAAIESCQRGMAFVPEWADFMLLAAAYAQAGDLAQARTAAAELLKREPAFRIAWLTEDDAAAVPLVRAQRDKQLIGGLRKAGAPE